MSFVVSKDGFRPRGDALMEWNEITSVHISCDHLDSDSEGIAVAAYDERGCGRSLGICRSEKGFASVVTALGRELQGLGVDWYKDARKRFDEYRAYQIEIWWREPGTSGPLQDSVPFAEPDAELWDWFERAGQKLVRKRKRSRNETYFLHVYELMNAIGNGGLIGYFSEPYGEHAHSAVKALQKMNATRTSRSLEKAIKYFPNGKISRSQRVRERHLEQMTDYRLNQLDSKLEDAIWSRDNEDWLMCLHDWHATQSSL